jgi:hypothetical protein
MRRRLGGMLAGRSVAFRRTRMFDRSLRRRSSNFLRGNNSCTRKEN